MSRQSDKNGLQITFYITITLHPVNALPKHWQNISEQNCYIQNEAGVNVKL